MEEKDHNAALIHPVASSLAETLPRPNSHTPGPWTVNTMPQIDSDGKPFGAIAYIKADTGHKEIAVLYGDDDQQANARLIALAPELLQIARASIDVILLMQEWARQVSDQYLDSDRGVRFEYAEDIQSANEAIRLYRAFIAKAEGRDQQPASHGTSGSVPSAAKKTPSQPDPDPHPGDPTAEDEIVPGVI